MRIQNNIMAMNTHRMYTTNNNNIQKSAEKLSSGYRINRAGDDAAGLAISEKMRSQIRGLNMASKNSQDAISLVQTAEGALQEVHSMLQRMNELAVQSATGTNQEFDRLQLAKEFNQLKREINDIAEQTTFNNMKILDGSLSSEGPERSAQTAGLLMSNNEGAVAANSGVKYDPAGNITVGGSSGNTTIAPTSSTPSVSNADGSKATVGFDLTTAATDGTAVIDTITIGNGSVTFDLTDSKNSAVGTLGGATSETATTIASALQGKTLTDTNGNEWLISGTGDGVIFTAKENGAHASVDTGAIAFSDTKTTAGGTITQAGTATNDVALVSIPSAGGDDTIDDAMAEYSIDLTTLSVGDTIKLGGESYTLQAGDFADETTLAGKLVTEFGSSLGITDNGTSNGTGVIKLSMAADNGNIEIGDMIITPVGAASTDAEGTYTIDLSTFKEGDTITFAGNEHTLTSADIASETAFATRLVALGGAAYSDNSTVDDSGEIKLKMSGASGDTISSLTHKAAGVANADDRSYLEIDRNKMREGDVLVLTTSDGTTHTATWNGEVQDFVDQLQTTLTDSTLKNNTLIIEGQLLKQDAVNLTPVDTPNEEYGTMRIQVGALEHEQLNIEVKSMNTAGLDLDESSLETQDSAGAAITATRSAVNVVSEQRALLGAMQNRLEHKISNLDNTAENLQAAEARIRDVDIAKEMTNFTKNNILAQAATAMLAQANAAPQGVLSLLQ